MLAEYTLSPSIKRSGEIDESIIKNLNNKMVEENVQEYIM